MYDVMVLKKLFKNLISLYYRCSTPKSSDRVKNEIKDVFKQESEQTFKGFFSYALFALKNSLKDH